MSTLASLATSTPPADGILGGPVAPDPSSLLPPPASPTIDDDTVARFSQDALEVFSDRWLSREDAIAELTRRLERYGVHGVGHWFNNPAIQTALDERDHSFAQLYKREMELLTRQAELAAEKERGRQAERELKAERARGYAICAEYLEEHRTFCEHGGLEMCNEDQRRKREEFAVECREVMARYVDMYGSPPTPVLV